VRGYQEPSGFSFEFREEVKLRSNSLGIAINHHANVVGVNPVEQIIKNSAAQA
jgi:hypothetical protein